LQLVPSSNNVFGHGVANFVDLNDEGSKDFMEYTCGKFTYDEHTGIDMFTTPFPWALMDANDQQVIAAAGGVIVTRVDGQFDQNCGDNKVIGTANYIAVRHDDGLVALYYHLKKNSLTAKKVGDRVEVGEFLAFVGSSGDSSAPHLHFELQDSAGRIVDPNAGTCGTGASLWKQQPKYKEPLVTRVGIHS
jgi:murein DD-endopeptidase MepM/ murein hydrolase activator NlpD